MNILFYTRYRPVHEKGGTEHTTSLIARELRNRYGYVCHAAYVYPFEGTTEGFAKEHRVAEDIPTATRQLTDIISQNNIDVAVVQSYFHEMTAFHHAVSKVKGCKLVFAHHFAPGWEVIENGTVKSKMQKAHGLKRLKYRFKLWLFPLFQLQSRLNMKKRYWLAYRRADHVVVLSESYVEPFLQLAGASGREKISVIPNALPFADKQENMDLDKKRHMVLMVTRLDERQKRIKLALEIWKQTLAKGDLSDWQLVILGDGDEPCVPQYEQYARHSAVHNVAFLGRQNPVGHYQQASIFMMTSRSEGLPLTLLECKSFGVVPIAFDTFALLKDVVTDGVDGVVVDSDDTEAFVGKLRKLMSDAQKRRAMAIKGYEQAGKFAVSQVMERWHKLLQSLKTE